MNRVGRTARIASSGQSIAFVLTCELEYVTYMKTTFGIEMHRKSRFTLAKLFE